MKQTFNIGMLPSNKDEYFDEIKESLDESETPDVIVKNKVINTLDVFKDIKQTLVEKGMVEEDTPNEELSQVIQNNSFLKSLFDIKKTCYYEFNNSPVTTEELNRTLSYDDTSNVTDMDYMFRGCTNLTTIPQLNTSNVITMQGIFHSCTSLTSIPLLNTSKVTNASYMFNSCSSITTIPSLNTSKVTTMNCMFDYCTNLTTIPQLDTSNVTTMQRMFTNCYKLTTIPLLNTSTVTNMQDMFNECNDLTSIPLLNTSKVTSMRNMFNGCTKLTTIPQLDTSGVTDMSYMFYNCSNLTSILMTGMKVNFDISSSTKFTREALVTILNNLSRVTSTKTLTMGATNLAKLTNTDKSIATSKGWKLA